MTLHIIKYPNPILKKRAVPVEKISKEVFELADKMIETMLKNDGIGLAANQVGFLLRLFIIKTALGEGESKLMPVINPEVLNQSGSVIEEEGCLSFPELYLHVARPEEVRIHGKNLYNESIVFEATGFLARAAMHEIDHLNGILFIERIEETEKEKVKQYIESLRKTKDIS